MRDSKVRINSQDNQAKFKVSFGSMTERSKNPKKQTNRVRTTKYASFCLVEWYRYTSYSFLPLSLLFQFKRAANIYFLIISVLTLMSFSPKVKNKNVLFYLESFLDDWNFRGSFSYHHG